MERAAFLKNVVGLALAPDLLKKIEEHTASGGEGVIVKEPIGKRIAIDVRALEHLSGAMGGKKWQVKDILEIYLTTGVLLYKKTPEMGPDYHPITVIDE